MTTTFVKQEAQLQKTLLAVLNHQDFSGWFKTKQLQTIFEKQINILGFLTRTNHSKDSQLDSIVKKYNDLSKNNFVIDIKTFYEDKDLLVDDINYLSIYVRNIYKIDLDAFVKGEKAEIVQSSVSEVQQKDRGFANKFGSFAMPGFGGMDNVPNESNPYFISLANMRLNDEIRKGNIYAFKTKPKLMPIFKYLIVAFALLATIGCILTGIGLIVSQNNPGFGTQTDLTWMGSFFLIFTICMGMITYTILKPMLTLTPSKKKNDNYLYYFRWQNVTFSLFFFILFMLISLSEPTNAFSVFGHSINEINSTTGPLLWLIGLIILLVGLSGVIGFTTATAFINPKSDRERMETIIKQYISEISSGQNPPFKK